MKKTWLIVLFLLLLSTTKVFAVKINSLYQGEVPVHSQSLQDRQQATQEALAQVLIKVSGNSQVISNPRIKSRLRMAASLIQEYTYAYPRLPVPDKPYLLQ